MDDNDTPDDNEKPDPSTGDPPLPKAKGLKLSDIKGKTVNDLPEDARAALMKAYEEVQWPLKVLREAEPPLSQVLRQLHDTENPISRMVRQQREQAAFTCEALASVRREAERFSALAHLFASPKSATGELGSLANWAATTLPLNQLLDTYSPGVGSLTQRMEAIRVGLLAGSDIHTQIALGVSEHLTRTTEMMRVATRGLHESLETASAVSRLAREAQEASLRVKAPLLSVGNLQSPLSGLVATSVFTALLAATTPTPSYLQPMTWAAAWASQALATVPDSPAWAEARSESPVVDSVAALNEIDAGEKATPSQILEVIARIAGVCVQDIKERPTIPVLLFLYSLFCWFANTALPMLQTAHYRDLDAQQPGIDQQIENGLKEALAPIERLLIQHQAELLTARTVVCIAETLANIRSGPSTKTKVIGKISGGQTALVIGAARGWREVEFVDALTGVAVKGWVSKRLLQDITLLHRDVEDLP